MSNSIWKTPDQKPEETGDIIYTFENGEIGYFFHVKGRKFPTSWLPRQLDYGLEEVVNMTKWCWLSDLLAQADKAERLQKAVDFLSGHLRDVLQLDEYGHIKLDEITKQQIKTAISDPVGIIMQLEQESKN